MSDRRLLTSTYFQLHEEHDTHTLTYKCQRASGAKAYIGVAAMYAGNVVAFLCT